jgi:hypothetical protein
MRSVVVFPERAEQSQEFAARDLEREVVHRHELPELFGDPA